MDKKSCQSIVELSDAVLLTLCSDLYGNKLPSGENGCVRVVADSWLPNTR